MANSKKIIAFAGRKGSGKTTAAKMTRAILGDKYKIKSFATPIKNFVTNLTGVTRKKLDNKDFKKTMSPLGITYRKLFQQVGAFMRTIDEDVFVKALFNTNCEYLIIDDLREDNEFQAVLDRGGIVIGLIGSEEEYDPDSSEKLSFLAKSDFIVKHVSLEHLHDTLIDILE